MNRQITLAARPEGFPQDSDFALVETEIPKPGHGEVLVRAQWLSLDPYMRGRMSEARSYAKPTELGEPMTGQAVGEDGEPQVEIVIPDGVDVAQRIQRTAHLPEQFARPCRVAGTRADHAEGEHRHELSVDQAVFARDDH